MKKCPVCNNMVDDSFAFCPHCGQKIEIVETEDNTNPSEDKTNEISQQPDADNIKEAETSPEPQDDAAAINPENEEIKDIPAAEDKQPVQEELPEATTDDKVEALEPDAGVNPEPPIEEGSAVMAQNAPVQDVLDENPLEYNPNLGGGQESEYDQSQNEYAEDGTYTDDAEGSYGNPDEPLGYEMQLIEEDDDKVNVPPKRKKSKAGWIALALLLLAALGGAAYYFLKDNSQGEDAAVKESEKNVKTVKQTPESKMPQQTDSIDADDDDDDAAVKDKVDKGVSKSQDEIEETQNVISDKAKQNNGGDKKGMKGIQNYENEKKKLEEGLKNGQTTKKEEKKSEKDLKREKKQQKKEEKRQKKEQKKQEKEEKKRNKNPN